MSIAASIPGYYRPRTVDALLAALVVFGVSGLLGGAGLVLDPSGEAMGLSTLLLLGSPFEDYLLPGLALFVVLGIGPLVVAYGLHRGHPWSWPGTLAVGVAVLIWFAVQADVIGWGYPLQWLYLALGVAILLLAILPSVRRYAGASSLTAELRWSGSE